MKPLPSAPRACWSIAWPSRAATASSPCRARASCRCSMRCTTAGVDRDGHLPPGRRRSLHGLRRRNDHRQARRLLRHPRPRRDQCQHRRACRDAGFAADDPVRGRCRQRTCATAKASRKSISPPSSARSPNGRRGSTIPPGSPNISPGPIRSRSPAGPARWCWRCRKTCWAMPVTGAAPRPAVVRPAQPPCPDAIASHARAARRCRRPGRDHRRRRLERQGA